MSIMCHTAKYARVIESASISEVERHYRTTMMGVNVHRPEGYVVYTEGTRAQLAHKHFVTDLTRFGDGCCQFCGLVMWSPAWVAEDVFGEATEEFTIARIKAWDERVSYDAPVTIAVVADLSDTQPAMLVGRKASVPQMARDLLV